MVGASAMMAQSSSLSMMDECSPVRSLQVWRRSQILKHFLNQKFSMAVTHSEPVQTLGRSVGQSREQQRQLGLGLALLVQDVFSSPSSRLITK